MMKTENITHRLSMNDLDVMIDWQDAGVRHQDFVDGYVWMMNDPRKRALGANLDNHEVVKLVSHHYDNHWYYQGEPQHVYAGPVISQDTDLRRVDKFNSLHVEQSETKGLYNTTY